MSTFNIFIQSRNKNVLLTEKYLYAPKSQVESKLLSDTSTTWYRKMCYISNLDCW